MILVLLAACSSIPETVQMSGIVWDAPYGEGVEVPGATLTVYDDAYAEVDSVTAASDGSFLAEVPAGVPFFVDVAAEGHVATAFSGTAGLGDFAAPDGYPWVATEAWVAALREQFVSCPDVDAEGGVVAGEVVADVGGYPVIATASARAYGSDGVELAACYLDDTGASVADGTEVGATGLFAIFGLPAGETVVDVRYSSGTGEDPVELYRFLAPEGGVVPIFPAILPLM